MLATSDCETSAAPGVSEKAAAPSRQSRAGWVRAEIARLRGRRAALQAVAADCWELQKLPEIEQSIRDADKSLLKLQTELVTLGGS